MRGKRTFTKRTFTTTLGILNIFISIMLIFVSFLPNAPSSPYSIGKMQEPIAQIYGTFFLSAGYGVIPLAIGTILINIMFLMGKGKIKYTILTALTTAGFAGMNSSISPELGGILGIKIREILSLMKLQDSLSITFLGTITFISAIIGLSDIIISPIKKLKERGKQEEGEGREMVRGEKEDMLEKGETENTEMLLGGYTGDGIDKREIFDMRETEERENNNRYKQPHAIKMKMDETTHTTQIMKLRTQISQEVDEKTYVQIKYEHRRRGERESRKKRCRERGSRETESREMESRKEEGESQV